MFGGAQSTMCEEDNCRVDVFLERAWLYHQLLSACSGLCYRPDSVLEMPDLCAPVLKCYRLAGESSVHRMCLCLCILPLSRITFNCSSEFKLLVRRSGLASAGQKKGRFMAWAEADGQDAGVFQFGICGK